MALQMGAKLDEGTMQQVPLQHMSPWKLHIPGTRHDHEIAQCARDRHIHRPSATMWAKERQWTKGT